MTQITLSPAQVEQLDAGPALVECRDSGGKVIGYLHVPGQYERFQIPAFSAERLEEFEREPGGRALTDILADLQKRR